VISLTAFVTAFIDRIGRLLARRGVAPFFLQLVGLDGHGRSSARACSDRWWLRGRGSPRTAWSIGSI
jgi:hypothetical protein